MRTAVLAVPTGRTGRLALFTTTAAFASNYVLTKDVDRVRYDVHSLQVEHLHLDEKIDQVQDDLVFKLRTTKTDLTDDIIRVKQITPDPLIPYPGPKKIDAQASQFRRFSR